MKPAFYWTDMLSWNIESVGSQKQQSAEEMQFTQTHYSYFGDQSLLLTPKCCVLSKETANTNFNVFDLTQPGIDPTTFCTSEYANHYTTEALLNAMCFKPKTYSM